MSSLNFGTIVLRDGIWHITCEAHVRMWLRRVFPQISRRVTDVITVSANEENTRNLLWFIQRYPMKVAQLKWMKAQAAAHDRGERAVNELLGGHRPPAKFDLALPPRKYQSEAADLLMIKQGLLLADDVGLGKTISAICPMVIPENLPALVVTLTHLPHQWLSELKRFAPHLKVHILKSGQPYDLAPKKRSKKGSKAGKNAHGATQSALFDSTSQDEEPGLPDVIISNYHKLSGWADRLAGQVKYVAFDEVQELRHDGSAKYAAAKMIARGARLNIGLAMTPIYNKGGEFFNVIDVLRPNALGSHAEFCREWCPDGEMIADPKAFGTYLRREGVMLRRTRKDVGRELPPCPRIPHTIASDSSVFDRIKGSAMELARLILADTESERNQRFRASEEFNTILRQATGIAKAPYVAEFIRMLMTTQEKVILFGWHRAVYGIWLDLLAEFKPMLYTGSESAIQKMAAKDAFITGDCRVLIISLRAGVGLDGLQSVCNTGVFGELDYSPGVIDQCVGRFHRDGQNLESMAYFLLSEDGSDPFIAELLGIKRNQMEGVRDPNADLIEALEVQPGTIKRLAESYLQSLGLHGARTADLADECSPA